VFAQRVRDLVAHHHRDFVVVELEPLEQAMEERESAPGMQKALICRLPNKLTSHFHCRARSFHS